MARNFRFPMGANPQDPRKKRLPIPEQYPYEPEVMEAPEELPDLPVQQFQAPMSALTPGLNRPTGPETLQPTPFRSLGQFRQWYTGQPADVLPGDVLPPSPEWGKRTPSYSRLNPPPVRQPKPVTPVQQPPVAAPPAPAMPTMPGQLPSAAGRRNFLDTSWLGQQAQAQQPTPGRLQPGTSVRVDQRNLAPGITPPAQPGQPLKPGMAAKAALTAAPSSRPFTPQERQMQSEAFLGGLKTEQGIERQAQKEFKQRQEAAERARIPGSIGGQIAGALFDTPQGQQVAGQFLNRYTRAVGGQIASLPTGLAAMSGSDVAVQAAQQDAKPIQDWLQKRFPIDAQKKDFLNAVLPEALGSVTGFALTGAATGGSALSGAMVGALMNAASTYDEARAAGVSHDNAAKAARIGGLIGSLEGAMGVGRNLDKLLKSRPMLETTYNIGEEGFQEVVSQALNNVNAKIVSGYDPQRALDEGFEAAILGGLAGGAAVEGAGALLRGTGRAVRNILTRPDGGVDKIPDALQDEIEPSGPEVPPAIPPDRQEAYRRLREQQRGQGIRPFPQRPGQPTETAGQPVPTTPPSVAPASGALAERQQRIREGAREVITQGPGTAFAKSTLETPGTRYSERTAPGVLSGVLGPQERGRTGVAMETARESLGAEQSPVTLREVTSTKGKRTPFGRGQYGPVAQSANKAPTFGFEPLKKAYGIPQSANRLELYQPIMENLASELGEIAGRDMSIIDVERLAGTLNQSALPPEEQNLWAKWYERYGRGYGVSKQDLRNIQDAAAGAGRGGFFDDNAVQQTLLGEPRNRGQNKNIQQIVREDMAKLLGYDINDPAMREFSQASVSPDMWRLWARSKGFDNPQRYPGVMAKLEQMIQEGELRRTAKTAPKFEKNVPIPRRTSGSARGASPTVTTPPSAPVVPPAPRPTPSPAPAPPVAARPSPAGERYGRQVQAGVPRAPLSMIPNVPSRRQGPGFGLVDQGQGFTTGRPQGPQPQRRLMPMGEEGREQEQARTTRERLRRESPFARGRQAERTRAEEGMRGRRPTPPPAEAVTPTPPPTPPVAPPAPSGQVSMRQRVMDAGWTIESSQRFTGPDGSVIERETGSRGKQAGWYHTDAAGNRTAYDTAEQALNDVLSRPTTAPVTPPPTKAAAPKPSRAKKEAVPTSTPPAKASVTEGLEGGAPPLDVNNLYFEKNLQYRVWLVVAGFKYDPESGNWSHPNYPGMQRTVAMAEISENNPPKRTELRALYDKLYERYKGTSPQKQPDIKPDEPPTAQPETTKFELLDFVKVPDKAPRYEKGELVGVRDVMVGGRVDRILPNGMIDVRLTQGGHYTLPPDQVQFVRHSDPESVARHKAFLELAEQGAPAAPTTSTTAPQPPRAKKEAKPAPAPVETAPTPAPEAAPRAAEGDKAETGAKTVRQRLAEKGWNQDDTFSMTHPDGSSITRERVGLWAYVDAAGNRTTYESQGEAISAALGDKPVKSTEVEKPETPVEKQVAAFVAQMNPMQKARVIATLRNQIRANGRIVSRQDLVYERVMAGDYTVIAHPTDKRRFGTEDTFLIENDISKTAMDFAEFLLKEKGYVREGDRYVPPSKPKTTPKTAETVQPVSAEDKAMLEDIDKNAKNAKQRKRIKMDYGNKGEKAIFIENNINEILKEAEESGKVTKQCP